MGEDPAREGLVNTPKRVEKALRFLTSGYRADIDEVINNALFTVDYNEMVIVKDIDFYSLCEHHLLPFFGKCHVAYIPTKKVIGLSKIPRLVEVFARRLQVQERLTHQIAEVIRDDVAPLGVAVVMEGTHLCMSMRGVEKQNSFAVTSAMLGAFRDNARTRMEFLELLKLRQAIPAPSQSRGCRASASNLHVSGYLTASRVIAALVLAGTYAVIALGRVPVLRVDRTGAAIIGAILMVVVGGLPFDEAVAGINARTIVLLYGMMVLVAHLPLAGFFGLLAQRVATGLPRRPRCSWRSCSPLASCRRSSSTTPSASSSLRWSSRLRALAGVQPAARASGARHRIEHRQRRDDHRQSAEHADRHRLADAVPAISHAIWRRSPSSASSLDALILMCDLSTGAGCQPRPGAHMSTIVRVHKPLLVKTLVVAAGMFAAFLAGYDSALVAAAGAAALLVTRRVKPEQDLRAGRLGSARPLRRILRRRRRCAPRGIRASAVRRAASDRRSIPSADSRS